MTRSYNTLDKSFIIQTSCPGTHANFFTSIPRSTGITVKLNFAMVNPNRSSTLGCHFSENRSSLSIGFRSSILPPKIVNMVAELFTSQYSPNSHRSRKKGEKGRRTHFALPNRLWKKLSVYARLLFRASALRLLNARLKSGIVILGLPSSHFAVATFSKSSTSCWSGAP